MNAGPIGNVPSHPSAGVKVRRGELAVLAGALVYPSLLTWAYFVYLAGKPGTAQQLAFAAGKSLQFALPACWVLLIAGQRRVPTARRGASWGAVVGILFGLLIGSAAWVLYTLGLKPSGLFDEPAKLVAEKVQQFGARGAVSYALLAAFYALIHSALEEYYWRWFVFGRLQHIVRWPWAAAISSIGFMAHHVIVLGYYFHFDSPATWFFSLCVAVGGAFWAWLYRQTDSLLGPWLSHALIDAVIFLVGYDLVRGIL